MAFRKEFAGKAYLKIDLLVKTPLHRRSMEVRRSGLWAPGLVKYNGHYDGLTSIPALMNRSYYCRHCDRGYNTQDTQHHNCQSQNCLACCRQNKTCPTFATWVKTTVHCPDCNSRFYGQDCFQAHKTKGKKKETKVFVTDGRNAHSAALNIK